MTTSKKNSSVSFSEEILIEILKRLPVKSLLRFRCVQKSWFNLIQDPYFIDVHSREQKNYKNKYLLFEVWLQTKFSVRFDDKQCQVYCPWMDFRKHIPRFRCLDDTRIVTSNGLLCLSGFKALVQHVYLWNPLIDKVKTLPNSPISFDDPLIQLDKVSVVAFGYLANMNDYKVIKFEIYLDTGEEPQSTFVCVKVYSLSTNSWKTLTIDNFPKSSSSVFINESVVVNGAAYWLGDIKSEKVILCFDIEKEIFRVIMLPQSDPLLPFRLLEFGEKLYVICWSLETARVEILILEGGIKEDWTPKVTLDNIDGGTLWWPLGFWNNGDLVLKSYTKNQHLFYNIKKAKTTKVVEDNLLCSQPQYVFFMSVFEENLVLLGDDR